MAKYYGFGIAVTKEMNPSTTANLISLLESAPKYGAGCVSDLIQYTKENPELDITVNQIPVEKCLEILYRYDSESFQSIAPILEAVIYEATGICIRAAKDIFTEAEYLLIEPRYPWYLSDSERDMTPSSLQDIIMKYLSIVSSVTPVFSEYAWDE